MKRLIKPTNRKRISDALPNLDNSSTCACSKESHWNMFRLLAFSSYRDEETGAVRVGREAVARAEGKQHLISSNSYTAKPFLTHFINFTLPPGTASLVVDADGRDWSVSTWEEISPGHSVKTGEGKQRRVLVTWPKEVQEAIDDELNGVYAHEESVYIDTGLKRSVKRERELLKADREEAANLVAIADSPRARYMAQYLNNLPTNKFTALADNYEAAELEVNKITNSHAKRVQKLILNTIKERPIPVYVPTAKSDRLFTMGASMQNLKKKVRKALTQGWYEADLAGAQLAIIARLWNIPEVEDFLASGKSLWNDFLAFYGLTKESLGDSYDTLKSTLKDHTYGLIFGMGEDRLLSELNEDLSSFGIQNGGNKFLTHPLISVILEARRKKIKALLSAGFVTVEEESADPFTPPVLNIVKVSKKNVLSILAQEAQRIEQMLVYPIFVLTNETKDFSITLLQHDGVSVSFSDESKRDYWIDRINKAVEDAANALGISTYLVWQKNELFDFSSAQQNATVVVIEETNEFARNATEQGEYRSFEDGYLPDLMSSNGEVVCRTDIELQEKIRGAQEDVEIKYTS